MAVVASRKETPALVHAIREYAEYLGEDPVATAFNVGNSFFAVNEDWKRANPKTPAEIMAHYRTSVPQVAQQIFATYGIGHEVAFREHVVRLVRPGETVLDLGAGIGSMILALSQCFCTHADVGGVMMRYAAWRYEKQKKNVHMIGLGDDYLERSPFGSRTWDVVICTEVIEHIVDPEAFVGFLRTLVRDGGKLVATTSFHDHDGMIPMHLNLDKWTDEKFAAEVFPRHDLRRVEQDVYVKEA